LRRKPVIQADLPKNARAVFERKVVARARRAGDCVITELQPSTLRPAILIGGLNLRAHQWAFAIYRGSIPAGLNVCHSCDVGRCINPDHLWLGTQKQNMDDMDAKGRRGTRRGGGGVDRRGERNPRSRLTEAQVREILAFRGRVPVRKLAVQIGVSRTHIWNIWVGLRWPHLQSK